MGAEGWGRYRKTALVRAKQINEAEDLPEDPRIIRSFQGGYTRDGQPEDVPDWGVETLEGDHGAVWGDYLCVGIEGELWPVKQRIFESTYEQVPDVGIESVGLCRCGGTVQGDPVEDLWWCTNCFSPNLEDAQEGPL